MFELIPILLLGALSGGIIGWVIGHQMGIASAASGGDPSGDESEAQRTANEEQQQLEAVARKIRALTLSVAADVSAHQSKVAGIASELQEAEPAHHSQSIVSAVAELVAANQAMQNRLSESQKQIREQTQQLQTTQQLANTDALTGLANRRALDAKLAEITQGQAGEPKPVIALVDIDYFKSVNDTFGHTAGDEVLSRVAGLIEARIGTQATCARYGGEEFAVVSDAAEWPEIAEALDAARLELGQMRLIPEDMSRVITYSSGVAEWVEGESSEAWLERADRALYAAKRGGRNAIYTARGEHIKRFSAVDPAVEEAQRRQKAPQRETSIDQLRSLAANVDLECVVLTAVAIRLPAIELEAGARKALLDRARSILRGVDRVDYEDPQTLLAMMVTTDTTKAVERGNELLDVVNKTLAELSDSPSTIAPATLGLGLLENDLTPEEVIRQAIQRAAAAPAATVG